MNYLAHIYLADITQTSRCGNFMGDFVKGELSQTNLLPKFKKGVYLHRKIDVFTDSHPIVVKSRRRISKTRRRYAGIIIDMAFDHFLALNWNDYHSQPLSHFVDNFYIELKESYQQLPESCQNITPYLIEGNWLENYADISGIAFGLDGIGRRMQRRFNRKNVLHNSIEEIIENFDVLENNFSHFFPELVNYVKTLLPLPH